MYRVILNLNKGLFLKSLKKNRETESHTIKIDTFAASFPKNKKSVNFIASLV